MKHDTAQGRFYEIDGKKYVSVTTVLGILSKPFLLPWAVNQTIQYIVDAGVSLEELKKKGSQVYQEAKNYHSLVKTEAADKGSRCHAAIEQYLKDGTLIFEPDIAQAIGAFMLWQKEHKFKILKSEHTVFSKKGYAGTLDILCELDGKTTLCDLKTSNKIWPEHYLQISAYAKACEQNTCLKIEQCGILRLGKEDGMPEWKPIKRTEINRAYKRFLCLLKYWQLTKKEV